MQSITGHNSIRILLSPLDWGLGHATRLMPIIDYCLAQHQEIDLHIAASGLGFQLLKKKYKNKAISFHALSDLEIKYSASSRYFIFKLISQFPQWIRKKNQDEKTISKLHSQYHFDIIISDNRYGIYHSDAYNIFITHQVQILTGMNTLVDKISLWLHRQLYKKYHELWVLDAPHREDAIAPRLSHPRVRHQHRHHYIGHLSQFSALTGDHLAKASHILILLSGPEPSRTILLNKLWEQACTLPHYSFTFITGKDTDDSQLYSSQAHIEVKGLLTTDEILDHAQTAQLIICRSGYSTIMDLIAFKKKALLIPTPGQTEQEYIGHHLQQQNYCYTVSQEHINLTDDIPAAMSSKGLPSDLEKNLNQGFIPALQAAIKKSISMRCS